MSKLLPLFPEEVREGDIAAPFEWNDCREVAEIDVHAGVVWLYLQSDDLAGPFPVDNYRFYRPTGKL